MKGIFLENRKNVPRWRIRHGLMPLKCVGCHKKVYGLRVPKAKYNLPAGAWSSSVVPTKQERVAVKNNHFHVSGHRAALTAKPHIQGIPVLSCQGNDSVSTRHGRPENSPGKLFKISCATINSQPIREAIMEGRPIGLQCLVSPIQYEQRPSRISAYACQQSRQRTNCTKCSYDKQLL